MKTGSVFTLCWKTKIRQGNGLETKVTQCLIHTQKKKQEVKTLETNPAHEDTALHGIREKIKEGLTTTSLGSCSQ